MVKALRTLVAVLVAGLVVGALRLIPSSAYAQSATALGRQHAVQFRMAGQEKAEEKTFTGQISQMDGKYILKESTSNTTYQLDDQDKAKQYDGKKVKVTGKLDDTTNTIHVSNIEPA